MSPDLATRIRELAAGQEWLVTAGQLRACGLTRRDVVAEVRACRWAAVLHGIYLVDCELYLDSPPPRTWWRAALLAEGPGACLVATTAARVLGIQGLPAVERTIEVAHVGGLSRVTRRLKPPAVSTFAEGPRVVVRQLPLRADEVVIAAGLRVRRADLTVVDAAIALDRPGALSLLDSALHQQAVGADELTTAIAAACGRPGIQQLRALARQADGRAESPVESRIRLACIDGGVPPDDLQHPVYTPDGHLVAVGDLGWFRGRRRPLLGEADGESVHSLPEPIFRDRRRGNALAGEACDTVRFTYADSFRPAYVCYVVRRALNAA